MISCKKHKGGDYMHERWRVLPRSLKHVYENVEEEETKMLVRHVNLI